MKFGELQFSAQQVAQVATDDMAGMAGDSQLDQMVVALVVQVGTPPEIDRRPAAGREEDVEQFVKIWKIWGQRTLLFKRICSLTPFLSGNLL